MNSGVLVVPVRTEEDYGSALSRIDALFDAQPGTREFDELDILTILVQEYERQHFAEPSEPATALRHYLDRMHLEPKDLEPFIGTKSMVSMVLNGKRRLSVRMIQRLHQGLKIPLALLVGPAG